MKYGNSPQWKRFFYSPVSIVIATIILIMIVRGGIGIHEKSILALQRLNQAQADLSDLERQKQSLANSISYLSTSQGMEAELREKYHAVKQGESVAVIVDQTSTNTPNIDNDVNQSNSASSTENNNSSWLENFLQFIGF